MSLDFRALNAAELVSQVTARGDSLLEGDALAILANPHCTTQVCQTIAQNRQLTSHYSVRMRLVGHRATPQAEAMRFIHFLFWPDLLRLSLDVRIPAPVRGALERQLLSRVEKLALGERVTAARRCSHELALKFLFDHVRVFAALLVNQRLREDDLLMFINSSRATVEKLTLIAGDRKWSNRYPIRKALVLNGTTPRAIAASQLRFLSKRDLAGIYSRPETSVYLKRCIEKLREADGRPKTVDFSPPAGRIE